MGPICSDIHVPGKEAREYRHYAPFVNACGGLVVGQFELVLFPSAK